METEDPNPFQPPESSGSMQKTLSVRPNFFDWFFAIFLSLLAAAIVFPSTCFGSVLVILMAEPVLRNGNDILAGVLAYGLLALCGGLTVFCAVWAARTYLKAVRKNTATRSSDQEDADV